MDADVDGRGCVQNKTSVFGTDYTKHKHAQHMHMVYIVYNIQCTSIPPLS